jgi:hypothetical protein
MTFEPFGRKAKTRNTEAVAVIVLVAITFNKVEIPLEQLENLSYTFQINSTVAIGNAQFKVCTNANFLRIRSSHH